MSFPTLEELLVETRLLSPTQLAVAQRDAQLRQQRLAPTVIALGLVDERRFAGWIGELTRTPLLHPIPDARVAALEHRVPRGIAREYEVVPVALENGELVVAMLNPLETACLDLLRDVVGVRVSAVLGLHSELTRLVSRFYPEDDLEATMLPGNMTIAASFGNETISAPPRAEVPTQLDRIERQLAKIATMVGDLQERMSALESAMSAERRNE